MACTDGSGDTVVREIKQLSTDMGLLHSFVHGTEEQSVALGGVDTDSIRRMVASFKHGADSQLALAENAANRAEMAADGASLASSAFNVLNGWLAEEDVAAGGSMKLPSWYYPGRGLLFLACRGVVCTPKTHLLEESGAFQFEEVGDGPDVLSNEVIVHFNVSRGDDFFMWVVASAAERNLDEIEERVEEARAAAAGAEAAKEAAEVLADRARAASACVPDVSTATARQIVMAIDGGEGMTAVYADAPSGLASRENTVLSGPLAAGDVFAVPSYIVGASRLQIFMDGLLCKPGTGADDGFYRESGLTGSASAQIVIFENLPAGTELAAIASS